MELNFYLDRFHFIKISFKLSFTVFDLFLEDLRTLECPFYEGFKKSTSLPKYSFRG